MKTIFNDGVMEGTLYPEGWLFLRWLQNKHGKLQRQLVRDLREAELFILTNKLKGWFTSSELKHYEFQILLHRVGARFMAKDQKYIYMNKWIQSEGDIYVRKCAQRPHVTTVS
jgi:hypothetical protein